MPGLLQKIGDMDLQRYEYYKAPRPRMYEFFSEGPKGRIRKIVKFSFRVSNGVPFYNMAFGDWLAEANGVNDSIVSNNGDIDRVLATVAAIVIDFTDDFPDSLIYGTGSNPVRTRLYRIYLNRFHEPLMSLFEIFGQRTDGVWEVFRPNTDYTGFIIKRRQ